MKFKTQYNSEEFEKNYEKSDMPSLTVPDQTMSITEILRRYASGLPLDKGKVPIWEGEEELPDIKRMDLVEIQELTQAAQEVITDAEEKLNKRQQKLKDHADRKKWEETFKREQEQTKEPAPTTRPVPESGTDK